MRVAPRLAFALTMFVFASSAKAGLVEFTFTGTGINGSTAAGSFTVDGGSLYPGYTAAGGIFPSLSLTISNIPGGGPTSVSFDVVEIGSTLFAVDAGGNVFIGPSGSHGFGPPDQHHYDLGPTQPFLPSLTFQSSLGYDLFGRDVITWSAATPVSLPEPGSAALMLAGVVTAGLLLRGATAQVDNLCHPYDCAFI